ncbi:MAG: DUF1186 domain-containing protein [Cyanobacteria bacterium J06632_3]
MELTEIIAELEYIRGSKFPHLAVKEAISQKEAITPLLLKALEDTKTNLEELHKQPDYFLHLYAMFLLAQFRETKAYPLLYELYSTPGEAVYDITGDILTEDFGRILASVSGGDVSLIKQLIEGEDVHETVRSSGMTAMLTLVAQGDLSRESVLNYFQELLAEIEEEDSAFASMLVINSLELYPNEAIIPIIRNAYEKDIVDVMWSDVDDLEQTLKEGLEKTLAHLQQGHNYQYVTDVDKEMSWWHCFQEETPRRTRTAPALTRLVPKLDAELTVDPKKDAAKRKQKRKAQKQARKKNRSKKKKK